MSRLHSSFFFFFFNDTATTEIYTLSLHDALPILDYVEARLGEIDRADFALWSDVAHGLAVGSYLDAAGISYLRSEEHTSELQSRLHLVCRLLLEKKKKEFGGITPSSTDITYPGVV